jgi:hypothetical protein
VARAALLLLLAAALPAPAAELGTLFHTPEERARLDRLRRGEPPEPVEAGARDPRTPAITGYVRRSDGRNTVWVDGTPVATRNDPRTFDPKVMLPKPAPKEGGAAKEGDPAKGATAAKAAEPAKGAETVKAPEPGQPADSGARQAATPASPGAKPAAPPGKS